ncbi:hypothetical protein LZC95_19615 [Pendulispora brunnea]|uniref:Uncharacterized protein n=1 Tax=Pendulispora brunnea TaxID=2905690 RepID=A0ABZ2KK12_9BACT
MESSSTHHSPACSEGKARRARALEFRRAGVSYEAIATQLNYTDPLAARWDVAQGLRGAVQDEPDDCARLELERLDAMLLGLWQRARQGDEAAIDRILRIMESRVRHLAELRAMSGQRV